MYTESFETLSPSETKKALERLNPLFDGARFDSDDTTILAGDLPFYPGCRLLHIAHHSVNPPLERFVVSGPDRDTVLNFTNEAVYALNEAVPLSLTESTVEEYVRFFFAHVQGPQGRFLIVDGVDDIGWIEDPPPAARKAVGGMIAPLSLRAVHKDGRFELEGCMTFRDALFKATIMVAPDGRIALEDESILIEDMPISDGILDR
jgi:hypothetical protein